MPELEKDKAVKKSSKKIYRMFYRAGTLLILLSIAATVFAFRFANSEYQRDLRNWEIRLGVTADTRAAGVESWIEDQFSELTAMADNTSLRLYMTEIGYTSEKTSEEKYDELAQVSFLRNYLNATAARTGFMEAPSAQVNANVAVSGNAGIALLDINGNALVVTDNIPSLGAEMSDFITKAAKGKRLMKDIFRSPSGVPSMAFLVPVFPVQGENLPEQQIGFIVGIKPVDELYAILKLPKSAEKTAETNLVRISDAVAEYISPLSDGTKPFARKLNLETPDFDVKFAAENVDKFAIKKDYASAKVIMTSRRIAGTEWLMIHKINASESLAESEERRAGLITISFLVIAFLMIVIIAVWRHGSSVRYKRLADEFKSQERLLRLVTDNQPDAMFILDKENRYCFANKQAARYAGVKSDSMVGKKARDVLGPSKAIEYETINGRLLEDTGTISHVRRIDDEAGTRIVQSKYIPLSRVPRVLTKQEVIPGMLVVEQNITSAINEREKRERILRELSDAMVSIIDRRDQHSSYQSVRVALFAESIASEMNLDDVMIETARTAGSLINLGKVMLPKELLTKKEKLSDDERKQVSDAMLSSADMLEGIEFDGPVVETLRQAQENYDGSGPLGKKGDDILITAQIISIANAYVAMTSPRAYRDEMPEEKVIEHFMDQIGKRYNRRVVVAFINFLENYDGSFDEVRAFLR